MANGSIQTKKENIIEKQQTENGYTLKKQILITLSSGDTVLQNKFLVTITKQNLKETKEVTNVDSNLAFDHIKIIYYALERLKNELEYTNIIFNLLSKEFTLTELKKCYELILNESLQMLILEEKLQRWFPLPIIIYRAKVLEIANFSLIIPFGIFPHLINKKKPLGSGFFIF